MNRIVTVGFLIAAALLLFSECAIKAVVKVLTIHRDYFYHVTYDVPVRWRIFQKSPESPLNLAADVLKLEYNPYHHNFQRHYENYYINVSMQKKIYIVKKIGKKNWTESDTKVEVPKIVEDIAIELLQESTKIFYGLKPTINANVEGKKKIMAYIQRPFDLNIVFLKYFLAEFGAFDRIFPYECKDNYKIICQLLEIKPPKSLRRAYAKNPYAIIWYMIFKQLGVKDVNFMQNFFLLRCIANDNISSFYFNKEEKKVAQKSYDSDWNEFEYFCKCFIKARGEKVFTNWLYKFSTVENLSQNQLDTIKMFYRYENHISEELKTKLFKNGLTWYIHDAMSAEVSDCLRERDNVEIFYDDKVLSCEGNINGYVFEVVKETKKLHYVGLELANCVATYKDTVLDLWSIIFVVSKDEKLVACIEICDGKIVQARGYHNQDLSDEVSLAVEEWKKLKNTDQMKYATAEIFKNGKRKKIYSPLEYDESYKVMQAEIDAILAVDRGGGGRGGDRITQAEIDALLAGGDVEDRFL